MKRVLVPLAAGFEEIEAVTIIDVLRRAGVEVTVAGLEDGPCRGSRGIVLIPDKTLDSCDPESFDLVVLPGGAPGAKALREDERVLRLLRAHHERGKVTAAICAAPTVLAAAGLVGDRQITSHPSVRSELQQQGVRLKDDRVVRDRSMITSQGPGTAMEFAYELVAELCGRDKVEELNRGILARV